MTKEVKNTALLLVLIILLLCGCKKNTKDIISSAPSVVTSSLPQSVVSETNEPYTLSTESEPGEPEKEPAASFPAAAQPSPPQIAEEPKPEVTIPEPPAPPSINIGFTVNDPYNTRGLSEVRCGYSFGVASGGMPNSVSVNNQLKFDSLQGVTALALDTVSADKRMYLTFDCGYEYNNLTASVLDTLKEKNVKAAFFCTLDYINKNPQLVHRMIDEGHIVGNHSATHANFSTISRTKMAEEIYIVYKYLQDNFGYTTDYFRFPEGVYTESALELVSSVGCKSIFWSVAYADWDTSKQPEPESAFATVTSRYHSGAVILLHTVSETNNAILGRLIDQATAEGYSFKTLNDYYN